MRAGLFFYFFSLAINVFAADASTRNYSLQTTMISYVGQEMPMGFWLSSCLSEKRPMYFANASGASIMANPSVVVSAYDSTSAKYNLSNFYALQNDRLKLIGHINGFSKGELFSIGYDSGVSTQKLMVSNALYLGYAKTFSLAKSSLTTFSVGGGVSESPCVDAYGRQYSCQSLTAWSDYRPNYPKPLAFLDFRHIWLF